MSRRKSRQARELRMVRVIDSMNAWVGSWFFLMIHIIWFIIWLAWNWDINLLTMIVSLEAIILMILLLMAQNRQSTRDDMRDEADYQADIRSLDKAEKILRELREIKRELKNRK